jgi:hypothetical protein
VKLARLVGALGRTTPLCEIRALEMRSLNRLRRTWPPLQSRSAESSAEVASSGLRYGFGTWS